MYLEWKALRWNRRCENQIHFRTFIKYIGETFLKLSLTNQECSYRCLVWSPSIRFSPSTLYCWPFCVMHGHIMQWPPRAADSSIVIVHHGAFSLLVSCPLTLCWGDSASFDNPAIGHQLLQKRQPFLSCRRTTGEAQVGINWKGNGEWRKENHKTEKRFAEV